MSKGAFWQAFFSISWKIKATLRRKTIYFGEWLWCCRCIFYAFLHSSGALASRFCSCGFVGPVFFTHLAAFFDRSGGLGLFFTHFSIVPALCVAEDRAAKTHCRRLDCQLVFFKLKNALWGHFFEALILLDFQGLQVL